MDQLISHLVTKECQTKFFSERDFTDPVCLKQTLSKGIGLGIVAASGILKVPQIMKILKSSSVEGLSSISLYIEVRLIFANFSRL